MESGKIAILSYGKFKKDVAANPWMTPADLHETTFALTSAGTCVPSLRTSLDSKIMPGSLRSVPIRSPTREMVKGLGKRDS